jgi:fucose 4-O-acetylase-like acetyltransferase
MDKKTARLGWLDAAKGLGIILVVIGHVWTRGPVRDAIYAFHMPLFFIAAGYTSKPAPLGAFAAKQWRALGIPYVAFLVCLLAADPLIEWSRGHAPMFQSWQAAVRAGLLGGTELRGPLTVFWFVPCLMLARVAQVVHYRLWPDPCDWRWAVAMAIALAGGVWWGSESDTSPLGIIAVPVALLLLWFGALWRTVGKDRLLVGLGGAASVLILTSHPLPLNMKVGRANHGSRYRADADDRRLQRLFDRSGRGRLRSRQAL